MPEDLGRALHTLTARLDRAADRFLRAEAGLSYSRFLALYMVGTFGPDTQRGLAERLGVTEPSASRMTRALQADGLLDVVADPAGGNRRQLTLTGAGEALVERWGSKLEQRFAALIDASGVPYGEYQEHTRRLLESLDVGVSRQGRAPLTRGGASAHHLDTEGHQG